jgi:Ca2+-binding RTX toxin-like protein
MDKTILAALWGGRRPTLMIALTAVLLALFASVAYAATFDGTSGNDRFIGTPQSDRAVMKAGDDLARGLDRSDSFFGNAGNDELYGNDGSDFLDGGRGDDLLVGGNGEDELVGSYDDDTIYTGTLTEGDKVSDEVQCGDGYDVVYLSGGDHASHNVQAGKCEEIHQY